MENKIPAAEDILAKSMNTLTGTMNYIVFDNPVSKGIGSVSKSAIGMVCKNGNSTSNVPQVIVDSKPLWKLAAEQGPFVKLAGLAGASAVVLGAYGSHKSYPKDNAKELKAIYETGNRFHFIHSLALLGVPLCRNPVMSGSLMLTGMVLFCGPCYYHAFTGENKFGKIAPIGGTVLILGWLAMVL